MRCVLGLALSAWAVTATAECLFYERGDVTLAGVVKYRGSAAILQLESPICVRSKHQDDPGTNVPRDNIRLVQLVVLPSIARPVPDSKIAATGILAAAHAGHHQTRVLLYVKAIDGATRVDNASAR